MGSLPAENEETLARSNVATRPIVILWWHHATVGVIAGAAIVATALLSQQLVGFVLVAAALLGAMASRIAAKALGTRLSIRVSAAAIGYLIALAVVVIGSLIVVWTVVRPDGPSWIAWMLATLVFLVVLGGTLVSQTKLEE